MAPPAASRQPRRGGATAGSGVDAVALADMSVEETFVFNAGSGDDVEIAISGITDVDAFFAILGSGDDSMEIADISALSGTFSGGSGSDVYIDGGGIEIDNFTESSISVEL